MASAASDEEIEVMEEVELSSDEEVDDDEEVSLIILKRPPAITRTVQDVEVTRSLGVLKAKGLNKKYDGGILLVHSFFF